MIRQRNAAAGTQAAPRRTTACACALAALLALCLLAWPRAALADEVGGDGSFDLNLSMSVAAADDPDAPVHPVSVHVSNLLGEHVGGARVAYALQSDYADPDAPVTAVVEPALAARTASGMVRAGSAVTAPDGTADLEGIVAGCDYMVSVEADGHTRYERVHTCKGDEGERWEVVMEKTGGSGGSGGSSGSTEPAGSPGAPGDDGGAGPLLRLPSLLVTGDALGPVALCAAGTLLAAAALIALALRRRGARDGR